MIILMYTSLLDRNQQSHVELKERTKEGMLAAASGLLGEKLSDEVLYSISYSIFSKMYVLIDSLKGLILACKFITTSTAADKEFFASVFPSCNFV